MDTKPLALTVGDPAGVGPEVIAGWLRAHSPVFPLAIIGPSPWLDTLPQGHWVPVPVSSDRFTPGQPTVAGARCALDAMEEAAGGTRAGRYSGVVTGPVSKSWLSKVGFPFSGQTEFFADRWGGTPTMAFSGGRLRVVLATWHIPLSAVPAALTADVLERSVYAAAHLAQSEGVVAPRIAVCGLNPHAGEEGLLGAEERDLINPLLERLRPTFPHLSTALPGDTVFARMLRGDFDVIVALYHDQGLAPLKTIDFDEAVNVTLGLPWVRTSPDHGTAFDIAGLGMARHTSFGQAVDVALRLINRRARR